jgi:hypothetical protein
MSDHISPQFHAEIIVELFNDCKDLRKVKERASILLSRASAAHLEEVSGSLPEHLAHLIPHHARRAA